MPTIKLPSPTMVFEMVTSDGRVMRACPTEVTSYVKHPEQWTAVFPGNSRVANSTRVWKSRDMFHPLGWVEHRGQWYPTTDPALFPDITAKTLDFKAYVASLSAERKEGLKESQLKTIFGAKAQELKAREEAAAKRAEALKAKRHKAYTGLALDING